MFRSLLACCIVACCASASIARSPIPDDITRISGNRYGLTDETGKDIVPPDYSTCDYVGNGLFLMAGINPKDRFHAAKDKHIFTRGGVELKFTLPADSELKEIFWLGTDAERDTTSELPDLPAETLLTFERGSKSGLCDRNGTVVVEPGEFVLNRVKIGDGLAVIRATAGKRAPVTKEGQQFRFSILDLKSRKIEVFPFDADELSAFSEGIAWFKPTRQYETFGFYRRDTGKSELRKEFWTVGAFRDGLCSVRLKQATDSSPKDAVIDDNFRIVSPKDMEVQEFYGELAVARNRKDKERKFGLVNKKFEYVVAPAYRSIMPIFENVGERFGSYIERSRVRNPALYWANALNAESYSALSPQGKLMFEFPEKFQRVEIIDAPDCLRVTRQNFQSFEVAYINFEGKRVQQPKRPERAGEVFSIAAPGIFTRCVLRDTSRFDPQLWLSGGAGHRLELFAQFLRENDLIGMPKSKVLELLNSNGHAEYVQPGTRAAIRYSLHYNLGLRIYFEDEKAVKWAFEKNGQSLAPYFTNVLVSDFSSPVPACKPKM